jgi:hypothetical protein
MLAETAVTDESGIHVVRGVANATSRNWIAMPCPSAGNVP